QRASEALDQPEILWERFKLPSHPFRERLGIHVLDVLEGSADERLMLWPNRRQGETAIAGNDGRDPVVRRRCQIRVPEDLSVEMRMNIDESRCDDAAPGID